MKKIFVLLLLAAAMGMFFSACSDSFLDKKPQGALSEEVLANAKGVEALLIAAYAELDGWAGWSVGAPWYSAGSNWVFGDVYADDAYKGTDVGDQPQINSIERYEHDASNVYLIGKWRALYDGVSRCNDVLRVLAKAEANGSVDADLANQIRAEARFLRGYYHMEAIKLWDYVPYIDENNTEALAPNDHIPWPEVEADFDFAYKTLPESPRNGQVGRATKWAAAALLGKAKLFQQDYAAAKPYFDDIINNGPYELAPSFHDNFRTAGDNNSESIFQIQAAVNEGTDGENGNWGDVLNFPYTGGPGECCGFYQPSQNLVNAFKTENGLPLLYTFNDEDVTNDQGCTSGQPDCCTEDGSGNCIEPYVPYQGPLDPRLDWTVGRKGIPYLDWGPHPGIAWIRDQAYAGPYSPKKNVFYKAEKGINSTASGWAQGPNANNYSIIRYADVLLMAAECEVEVGSLEKAREYVNKVRARAADPSTWVMNDDGSPAANYQISTYDDPWTDQNFARDAVRFERRLELAMEGHRFFDLKRWGVAEQVLDAYLAVESTKRTYLQGADFKPYNVRHPIPQTAIDLSEGTLVQNEGY